MDVSVSATQLFGSGFRAPVMLRFQPHEQGVRVMLFDNENPQPVLISTYDIVRHEVLPDNILALFLSSVGTTDVLFQFDNKSSLEAALNVLQSTRAPQVEHQAHTLDSAVAAISASPRRQRNIPCAVEYSGQSFDSVISFQGDRLLAVRLADMRQLFSVLLAEIRCITRLARAASFLFALRNGRYFIAHFNSAAWLSCAAAEVTKHARFSQIEFAADASGDRPARPRARASPATSPPAPRGGPDRPRAPGAASVFDRLYNESLQKRSPSPRRGSKSTSPRKHPAPERQTALEGRDPQAALDGFSWAEFPFEGTRDDLDPSFILRAEAQPAPQPRAEAQPAEEPDCTTKVPELACLPCFPTFAPAMARPPTPDERTLAAFHKQMITGFPFSVLLADDTVVESKIHFDGRELVLDGRDGAELVRTDVSNIDAVSQELPDGVPAAAGFTAGKTLAVVFRGGRVALLHNRVSFYSKKCALNVQQIALHATALWPRRD
eukprot:gnl/Chilomastix_cuspidata/1702.p1 GENE.gnl/Chilomastix_cuspidata/1702~~gnl/Chilomastix_cuspidata/1702.p1  ORF type:complete len:493 (+),score=95.66 gnl/Chilomastix_cuspidata/1702:75-1553(+)